MTCPDCGTTFYGGYVGLKLSSFERLSCGCRITVEYPRYLINGVDPDGAVNRNYGL